MRLTGLILVALAAVLLFGWYRPFEGACSGALFAVFVTVWALLTRARSRGVDEEGEYPNDRLPLRELVMGVFIGLVWTLLSTAAIHALHGTRVRGWFVDEPGEALAHDLEVLARNGAWPSILSRMDGPLPEHSAGAAQTAIDHFHYLALTRTAAVVNDPDARCAAQRAAELFAARHGIDPMDRVPVSCQPTAPRTNGANLRILKQSPDATGRTVLSVSVADASGAPVAGLTAASFLVVADGREVAVAEVKYAPAVSPPRRLLVMMVPMRSRAHRDLALAARGLLAGLIRPTDRAETIACCISGRDLSGGLLSAIDQLGRQPGDLILFTEPEEPLASETTSALQRRLRDADVPLHLVLFGPGTSEFERISRDSGGSQVRVTGDNIATARNAMAPAIAREGVYYIVLGARLNRVRIALSSPRSGVVK